MENGPQDVYHAYKLQQKKEKYGRVKIREKSNVISCGINIGLLSIFDSLDLRSKQK